MARIREISWVYDWGFLDEPVMIAGPVVFNWRRIMGLFPLFLLAFILRAGSKMPIRGFPLGLDQLLFAGVSIGLAALLLAPRGVVPVEQQLIGLLFPVSRRRASERRKVERTLVVRADVLPYTIEVSGYALDLGTGEPLKTNVLVIVDGREIEVTPDKGGRYRARVELGPGLHTVVVELKEPRIRLKEFRVEVRPR